MNLILMLIAALSPVAVLLYYVYRRDSLQPEPVGMLMKAFLFGTLSIPLSLCISTPLEALGFFVNEPQTLWDAVALSFFGAAIPEEFAKFCILWLFLRKNRCMDEKMDGIVYAVCISMGFAAVENIMYLVNNFDQWVSTGIVRALFAVPGHFTFGVLMGYYYSLVRFYPHTRARNQVLVLGAPILAHGLYDTIAFLQDVAPMIGGVIFLFFIFFCFRLWRYGSRKIADLISRDRESGIRTGIYLCTVINDQVVSRVHILNDTIPYSKTYNVRLGGRKDLRVEIDSGIYPVRVHQLFGTYVDILTVSLKIDVYGNVSLELSKDGIVRIVPISGPVS